MAISMRLNTRGRTAVATATRSPRYARNDKLGRHEKWVRMRGWRPLHTHFDLSLRTAPAHPELVEGRGNLDEVEHTSANRRRYGDEIATLRS